MPVIRLNVIAVLLFTVLIFMQYRLWFQSGGVLDMLKMKNALVAQKETNERLKKNNDELVFQIQRLQNSKDAAEARARNELGMVKKNETFYQVVKSPNESKG
jgi:cell division protein FtsB